MTAVKHKKCSSCGCEYPDTNKYFSYQNKAKGQLHARCKVCFSLYERRERHHRIAGDQWPSAEPKVPVQYTQTERGTTIVRFGEGWRSNSSPRRLESFYGYQSGFEK